MPVGLVSTDPTPPIRTVSSTGGMLASKKAAAGSRARRDATAVAKRPLPRELRMRDLVRESGLSRETIHFYLSAGLLPPPRRTGRNTALYGREHLERLRRIRELREQQFLPLKAIRAILAEERLDATFTPAQRELVRRIRASLRGWLRPEGSGGMLSLSRVARGRVSRRDIEELEAAGLVDVGRSGRSARLCEEDAQVVETWAQLKEIGFSPERGFAPREMKVFDEVIERLVREEVALFTARYKDVSGGRAAWLVEQAIPIVNQLLPILHRKKMRKFFAGTLAARVGKRSTIPATRGRVRTGT